MPDFHPTPEQLVAANAVADQEMARVAIGLDQMVGIMRQALLRDVPRSAAWAMTYSVIGDHTDHAGHTARTDFCRQTQDGQLALAVLRLAEQGIGRQEQDPECE
jgi:hypothetical protein